jgi:hypothetical protein
VRFGISAWVALVCFACSGGGSSTVPIDQIPPDKKLVDLSSGEMQGLCDWVTGLARQKLAGATCNGSPISINSCMPVGPSCPATVSEYRACIPNLLDRFASDPCQIINLAFSQTALESFIDNTPGCAGQGPCATAMH